MRTNYDQELDTLQKENMYLIKKVIDLTKKQKSQIFNPGDTISSLPNDTTLSDQPPGVDFIASQNKRISFFMKP